jgi:uncharacterized membrane-anchored protein
MIHGLIVAAISSLVGGLYLHYFYALELDESYKVLPIWKVVSIYIALSLFLSLILMIASRVLKKWGVIVLNTVLTMASVASIALPITYINQEIDTTFIAVAAIPVHFIMPIIWLALQPLTVSSSHEA